MTTDTLKRRALKASADSVEQSVKASDAVQASLWADTALTLLKVAAECDVMLRLAS